MYGKNTRRLVHLDPGASIMSRVILPTRFPYRMASIICWLKMPRLSLSLYRQEPSREVKLALIAGSIPSGRDYTALKTPVFLFDSVSRVNC